MRSTALNIPLWTARLESARESYRPRVPSEPPPSASPVITVPVPQADRHLLALHALRQRQICTSFLHGRRRTWRDRRRIWPAVVIALALVALIIAGTSVVAAFQRQQQVEAERARRAPVSELSGRESVPGMPKGR